MFKKFAVLAGVLVAGSVCYAAQYEDFNVGQLSINGVKITKTATQINAGNTSTLTVTNVTLTKYTASLTNVVAGVTNVFSVVTNATISLQRVP